jgi:hypothetical protein
MLTVPRVKKPKDEARSTETIRVSFERLLRESASPARKAVQTRPTMIVMATIVRMSRPDSFMPRIVYRGLM